MVSPHPHFQQDSEERLDRHTCSTVASSLCGCSPCWLTWRWRIKSPFTVPLSEYWHLVSYCPTTKSRDSPRPTEVPVLPLPHGSFTSYPGQLLSVYQCVREGHPTQVHTSQVPRACHSSWPTAGWSQAHWQYLQRGEHQAPRPAHRPSVLSSIPAASEDLEHTRSSALGGGGGGAEGTAPHCCLQHLETSAGARMSRLARIGGQ